MSSIREDGSRLEISLCLPLQPDVFVYYTISLVRTGKMVEGKEGERWEEGGNGGTGRLRERKVERRMERGGAREGWDESVMRVVV